MRDERALIPRDGETSSGTDLIQRVFREHYDFVIDCARRFGVAPQAREDVAQEVFMKTFERLKKFESYAQPRAWLYITTKFIVKNHMRSDYRTTRKHAALSFASTHPLIAASDAERRVTFEWIESMVAQLPDTQREIYELTILEEMTGKEIAQALGLNEHTVRSRLREARRHIRRIITRTGNEGAKVSEGHIVALARANKQRRADTKMMPVFMPSLAMLGGATQGSRAELDSELDVWLEDPSLSPSAASLGQWPGPRSTPRLASDATPHAMPSGFLPSLRLKWGLGGMTMGLVAGFLAAKLGSTDGAVLSEEFVSSSDFAALSLAIPGEPRQVRQALSRPGIRVDVGKAERVDVQPVRSSKHRSGSGDADSRVGRHPNAHRKDFRQEVELIRSAQEARLDADWNAADRLLRRYFQKFPRGSLIHLAAVERVRTLCTRQGLDRAIRAARNFQSDLHLDGSLFEPALETCPPSTTGTRASEHAQALGRLR